MYKNAGIKSKKEAAARLLDGEKFYYKGLEMSFDPAFTHPFRAGEGGLTRSWRYCTEWEEWNVKPEWYDDLGEGVLCWVWDGNEEPRRRLGVVVRYVPSEDIFKFGLKNGVWYEHAEPMTAEEVKELLWGEK